MKIRLFFQGAGTPPLLFVMIPVRGPAIQGASQKKIRAAEKI